MENTNNAETIIWCDADDFCEGNDKFELLSEIKKINPDFRINLFTIVGRSSKQWLDSMKSIEWIHMIPHGWIHDTPRECELWSYDQSRMYLDAMEKYKLERGFKAPGWQISDGMYKALVEYGYWVADQHYNDERRPKELRVHYATNEHYHIGHLGGHNVNEIGFFKEYLIKLRGKYMFLK